LENPRVNISKSPFGWLALALACFLLSLFFDTGYSSQRAFTNSYDRLQQYIQHSQEEFESGFTDTLVIRELAVSSREGADPGDFSFPVFVYRKTPFTGVSLVYWSSHSCQPEEEFLSRPDGSWFKILDNGYYLCMKKSVAADKQGDSLVVIGLIPVQHEYFIETPYLPSRFAHDRYANQFMAISGTKTDHPVSGKNGESLFYIYQIERGAIKSESVPGVFLKFSACILLLAFVFSVTERTEKRKGALTAFLILFSLLLVIRITTYLTSFPINFRQFKMFDPTIYGSDPVQKSLGDILINAVFLCWLSLFAWFRLMRTEVVQLIHTGRRQGNILAGFFVLLLVLFSFFMASTIRSLAADSNISFDVVNFFSLNVYSVIGFVVLALLAIGYFFISRILLKIIFSLWRAPVYQVYIILAVAGLSYLTVNIRNPFMVFYMIVLAWLVGYTWLQNQDRFLVNRPVFTLGSNLFWIFIFSFSITAIISEANRSKEWEIRKRIADRIDTQTDPYNEKQLSISFAYIDDAFLRDNFYRFMNPETASVLRDSILRAGGYLNKYDTRLYVFDADGKPLVRDDVETMNTLNAIIDVESKKTNTPNLYFHETAFDKYTFIFKRDAQDESGNRIGSLFVVSYPEKYSTEALYPELFGEENEFQLEESPNYSYAVYRNGVLGSGLSNRYAFATRIGTQEMPETLYEKRINGNFVELWYRVSQDKIVVVAKRRATMIESITLFSYIFCSFLLLAVFLNFLLFLFGLWRGKKSFGEIWQWTIRGQVHSTIIFVSILSFVIIGVATISFFIKRFNQNNREKLSRTMQIMVNEMEKKLDKRLIFDDQVAIYDSVSNQEVVDLVNEVAEIHGVDVNIYDTAGNLQITSQKLIYREGILSRIMHPEAYRHLVRLRQVQFIQEEKLSELKYMSIYAPIRSEGVTYAFLNIPYFLSQRELKQEISNFLVAIINLNAFIFLIAGVIALFITNRVTRSFSLIGEKMKDMNLGSANQEITWNRNDEIGGLVREYNKMVKKLEVSAEALARSEREGAWREMAKQVAHEIKNPLTPMKLSIQYLQRSIDNNAGDVKHLAASVAKTLVEQIDHLSKIAFDFSQFANIGNTTPELFNLTEVLSSLKDLYNRNETVEIQFDDVDEEILLYSDKTQMNRLFTNLFQNAVESSAENEKCRISIRSVMNKKKVTVSVRDNGSGIPEEMQARIFMPNFTTKTSGSGMGLAICKGIVEKAGGRIWFETERGRGSSFYVELPLAD